MTAHRDRDRLLENSLKHGLSSAAPWTSASQCLDAETLAAWADGGLDRQQMALAEAHLSNCGECQALLSALTQTVPADEAVARAGTNSLWRWWLAPVAATAAAITLWMVVPRQAYVAPPAAPTVAAETDRPGATVPATPEPSAAPAAANSAPARQEATPPAPERARAPEPAATLQEQVKTEKASPLPAAPQPAEFAAAESRRDQAAARQAGAPAAVGAAAPPAPAPPSPVAAPPAAAAPQPAVAGQIVSPDARFRWRYSSAGLHYSTDGGLTWEQVSTAIGRFVMGGSAPSSTVCWLIARGGGVFVTGDGRNFFRARFPEITNLVSVTATSRASATVATTDGRTFATVDGGVTWQQRP